MLVQCAGPAFVFPGCQQYLLTLLTASHALLFQLRTLFLNSYKYSELETSQPCIDGA